jgi:hypothetical protein
VRLGGLQSLNRLFAQPDRETWPHHGGDGTAWGKCEPTSAKPGAGSRFAGIGSTVQMKTPEGSDTGTNKISRPPSPYPAPLCPVGFAGLVA